MSQETELKKLIDSEPPREEGKHRFLGGTCVDCGHPLDEICTANLDLSHAYRAVGKGER